MSSFHPEDYAEELLGCFPELTDGDKVLMGLQMVADAIAEGLAGIRVAIAPIECGPQANVVEGMMKAAEILGKEITLGASYIAARD
jgi:hypothetical protein